MICNKIMQLKIYVKYEELKSIYSLTYYYTFPGL